MADPHRVSQSVGVRTPRGPHRFAERPTQKVVARFGLDGHKLIAVLGLQLSTQSAGVNFFGPANELVNVFSGHRSSFCSPNLTYPRRALFGNREAASAF